jgi:hypothetical protein
LPIEVALGARRVRVATATLAAEAGDWPALGAELATHLPARACLNVTVADHWVRYFLFERPPSIHSLRDARLLLGARFESLYGDGAADWLLQADWHAAGPMLACALPRALGEAFAPYRLAHLLPATLGLWNRAAARLPASAAWCAEAEGRYTLLVWSERQLRVVRQLHGGDPQATLALECARLDLAPPQARLWSGAAMPPGWAALEAHA